MNQKSSTEFSNAVAELQKNGLPYDVAFNRVLSQRPDLAGQMRRSSLNSQRPKNWSRSALRSEFQNEDLLQWLGSNLLSEFSPTLRLALGIKSKDTDQGVLAKLAANVNEISYGESMFLWQTLVRLVSRRVAGEQAAIAKVRELFPALTDKLTWPAAKTTAPLPQGAKPPWAKTAQVTNDAAPDPGCLGSNVYSALPGSLSELLCPVSRTDADVVDAIKSKGPNLNSDDDLDNLWQFVCNRVRFVKQCSRNDANKQATQLFPELADAAGAVAA